MNMKEFEAVVKLSSAKKYEYFIKRVVDFEEVWGLYSNGWASADDGKGNIVIPFFPKKEYAENCATDVWENYKAKSIDLYKFIENWLPGMKKDKVKPSIFPTKDNASVIETDELYKDLQNELNKY
ncbi:DUF2750 domain-containing protein [Paenibacillus sp. SYP-B3998]|uniref:DUF2750 domain-containing protein n=1 Tax=Paenibacillus sp. SYP-B3998 TaxID=2678564 RepID=A0A6G3ZTG7_9BACL|nr:DUF2750 domain-containing protein [Paenibacillus sp. SYP-B3998]NEW04881.1 DUF2750 domain-containing protein [Paenibacillus sp. SYP-B3998]